MIVNLHAMAGSALLIAIVGISTAVEKCTMWEEIQPCTCRKDSFITVNCSGRSSYVEIAKNLKGHFTPENRVHLDINNSTLFDLNFGTFKELNMTIENLKLNHVTIGNPLNESTFDGLNQVKYLSLSDSILNDVPEKLWEKMPNIGTLDLGRSHLHYLKSTNFENLPVLEHLIIPGNFISWMDVDTFPKQLTQLHIGRNLIRHLNNTLMHLSNLNWLFLNANKLDTLEGQLPLVAPKLDMIHAGDNELEKLPQQLKTFSNLKSLFFRNNKLTSLDGAISKARRLVRLNLEENFINTITKEDFEETEKLEMIILRHNSLTTLNNSLGNLRNLRFLDVSHNKLEEFSLQDLVGLELLKDIDLSNNKISKLTGPAANLVEWNIKLQEMKLDHNLLETLNGALSGLPHLEILNLSHNKLKLISPDDLIGLDQLELLDLSYNQLTTLEEMSKTFLPKLSTLKATHNYLTILEKDFHGLPVLCYADFEQNQIIALGRDLVAKTRCEISNTNEGTWDTLKINLQDNPILCDAALPEITNIMEVNHTKISGVTKTCLPLIEQPVTSKPNAFLGYIPETTSATSLVVTEHHELPDEPVNTLPVLNEPLPDSTNSFKYVPEIQGGFTNNQQYTVETDLQQSQTNHLAPLALQSIDNALTPNNTSETLPLADLKPPEVATANEKQPEIVPIVDSHPAADATRIQQELLANEQKISKLEAQIKQLTLDDIVLNNRLNKSLQTSTEAPTDITKDHRKA